MFSEEYEGHKKTLIFDKAAQFTSIDYSWSDIKGIKISTAALKVGRKQAFFSAPSGESS